MEIFGAENGFVKIGPGLHATISIKVETGKK